MSEKIEEAINKYLGTNGLHFFTDEAASAMLLDKLLEAGYCLLQVGRSYVICWPKAFQNGFCVRAEVMDEDRKVVVVLAFLAYAKLEAK